MPSLVVPLKIEAASLAPLAALGQEAILGVRKAIARGVNNRLIEHMDQMETERPNRMGGTRTHFFGQIRDALAQADPSDTGDAINITINQVGFAQRYFGGVIKAGQGVSSSTGQATTYLAIPARAEAYGMRPSDFNDLHFIPTARGGALVENERQAVRIGKPRKDGSRKVTPGAESGGGVMFWLVTQVTQKPDPSILPTDAQIAEAGVAAGTAYMDLQLARAAQGGAN